MFVKFPENHTIEEYLNESVKIPQDESSSDDDEEVLSDADNAQQDNSNAHKQEKPTKSVATKKDVGWGVFGFF